MSPRISRLSAVAALAAVASAATASVNASSPAEPCAQIANLAAAGSEFLCPLAESSTPALTQRSTDILQPARTCLPRVDSIQIRPRSELR